jgi:ABC-type polysaccharide/polyol phosphate transport system ATPase subunit
MVHIKVDHVTKEYRLGKVANAAEGLRHIFFGLTGLHLTKKPPFKALDDVNFEVKQGEVLGIIGMNGAGKSTLLKLLSRIIDPTKGKIAVCGTVAPLIELGAGMNPELTGRENIYLNAAIMGLSRAQIKKKFDEIVAFSEIKKFIDTPIKRYSSGMTVRLGFSIATAMDADILIVDEVLAVGDLAFQRKCFDRMEDMIQKHGKTVILVSHAIYQVQRICSRVILLNHGKIVAEGSPKEVCSKYYEISDEKIAKEHKHQAGGAIRSIINTGEIDLISATTEDASGAAVNVIDYGGDVTFSFIFKVNKELTKPVFAFGVHTTELLYVTIDWSGRDISKITPGTIKVRCHIKKLPILAGIYSIRICVSVGDIPTSSFYAENVVSFKVKGVSEESKQGFIALRPVWEIGEVNDGQTVRL